MSRLLLVVVLTVAGVVPLFVQQQPSVDTSAAVRLRCQHMLFAASRGATNCSMQRAALLARATRGTLGGERRRITRVRTNASPRL